MIENKMNNSTEAAEKGFLVPTGQGPYSLNATSERPFLFTTLGKIGWKTVVFRKHFCVGFLSKSCHHPIPTSPT